MSRLDVIPPEVLDRFVEERVRSGAVSPDEAADRPAMDHLFRAERLRALAQVGIDQIERGEGVVVEDIDAHFDQIWAEVQERAAIRATPRRIA